MGMINQEDLFDQLKIYIDKKIDEAQNIMDEILEEHHVAEVFLHLDEIQTVANNMRHVNTVSNSIYSVLICSLNMNYIKYAPTAAKDALAYSVNSRDSAIESKTFMDQSMRWAIEEVDTPVDDGIHNGYSAYHWATKAADIVQPDSYYWRDGSRPITANLQAGGYKIVNVAAGTIGTDGINKEQLDNHNHDTVYAPLVHTHVEADITDLDKYTVSEVDTLLTGKADTVHTHVESDITDLDKYTQTEVDNLLTGKSDTGHNHDSLYYLESEHLSTSSGSADAGKPIVLNSSGKVDASMMAVSGGYEFQGTFTPIDTAEYPDTTGLDAGAFWDIQGVDDTNGYTFVGGDLAGETIENGNLMIFTGTDTWQIKVTDMNPTLYYKLDGSQAITGNFAGGGFAITNIIAGTVDGDGIEYKQWIDANAIQNTDIVTAQTSADTAQTDIDSHKIANNPHSITVDSIGAAWENHGHKIAEVEDLWDELTARAKIHYVDQEVATKEPTVGLGSPNQIWAMNDIGDAKEWIDSPPGTFSGLTDTPDDMSTFMQHFVRVNATGDALGYTLLNQVDIEDMVTDGDGNSFLANDGTYKAVSGGGGTFEFTEQDGTSLDMFNTTGVVQINNAIDIPGSDVDGSLYVTNSVDIVVQLWITATEMYHRTSIDNGSTWNTWTAPGSLDDAPSDGTLYGRLDAGWSNAEPLVANGTTGQVWTMNSAGDGKEWTTIDTGLPHFNSGDYMTGTIGGDDTQKIFGMESDTMYIGPVDSSTTPVIARGDWDFQGTGIVPTKQEGGVGILIGNMIQVTQVEYDALTPEANTFYVIVG